MRTDNQSCKQIARKSGVSKIGDLDGRYLLIQERVADGTVAVGSVDGGVNPSDLGTKVPASAARLKALLFMRHVVDSSGDYFVPVGQPEYEQLMTKFENAQQSMRVRRLMNKIVAQWRPHQSLHLPTATQHAEHCVSQHSA